MVDLSYPLFVQEDELSMFNRGVRKVLNCQVVHVQTSRGTSIVAAYVPIRKDSQRTILFSHGNAVDLGLMLPFYWSVFSRKSVS